MSAQTSPPDSPSDREFMITRVFDAPRELMWQAWTEPQHMMQWWGPRAFTNPICTIELRLGGVYHFVMRSPEGVDYPLKGIYQEIVEPERLVMSMDCSGHPEEWHDLVNPNRKKGDPSIEMIQTVTFEDLRGKTRLTIRTRFESTAIRDAMKAMGMTEGWSQSLDRLGELLPKLCP